MSVKLEWVPAIEASDRLKAGWVEIELHGGIEAAPGCFLMASPVDRETQQTKPEDQALVVCPNCGNLTSESHAGNYLPWICTKPAQPEPTTADRIAADLAAGTFRGVQPEPAAPEAPAERAGNGDVQGEMPEAVKMAIYQLRQNVRLWQLYGEQPASEVDRKAADALESWWRSRTQPVGITEELESVLRSAKEYEMAVRTGTRVEWHAYDADRIGAAIAAVRSQYRRKG